MKCIFYYNQSDPNHLTKTLTELGECDIVLKEATGILNPVLTIANLDIDWVGQFNYLYIPDLKRYYYAGEPTAEREGLWSVSAHVDVLQTYREYILQQTGVIGRQEYQYNLLLDDEFLKAYSNPIVQTKKFFNGFNRDSSTYVIVALGQ